MSFGKSKKHSGIILAGVTTASVAASAASQGVVRALPQNSAATSLANNVSGENVKNVGSSTVNFLKDNYGWVAIIVVAIGVISILKWGFSGGDEKKETVINTNNDEEKGLTNELELTKDSEQGNNSEKEYIENPWRKSGIRNNSKSDDNNEVNNSLNIIVNKNETNDDVKNSLKVNGCDEVSHSLNNNLDISREAPKDDFENLGEYYINGG